MGSQSLSFHSEQSALVLSDRIHSLKRPEHGNLQRLSNQMIAGEGASVIVELRDQQIDRAFVLLVQEFTIIGAFLVYSSLFGELCRKLLPIITI